VCVEGDRYAIELLRVQEVVRVAPVVGMRGADPAVLGVMNLRGRIVPVFDLGLWLGTRPVNPDEHSRIVVVERDDELIGLLATAVNDVVTLTSEHIEPPFGAGHPGAVVGVARADEAPTVLLDANWLFD
jgi:purine-binding chemotaxis protein CheW